MKFEKMQKLIEKGNIKKIEKQITRHFEEEKYCLGSYLCRAIRQRNTQLIDLFLYYSPETDPAALVVAADAGDAGIVRYLLEKGVPPNTAGIGYTPLIKAAEEGNLEIVRLLVENGADVNMELGEWGKLRCALSKAIVKQRTDVVAYLAENGPDLQRVFSYALPMGGRGGSDLGEGQAVRTFLKSRAIQDILLPKIYELDEERCSTIFANIFRALPYYYHEYEKYINLFLDNRARLNADCLALALSMVVYITEDTVLVRRLAEYGADLRKRVYAPDYGEVTAAELAQKKGKTEIAALLAEYENK